MDINKIVKEVHETAITKGWWECKICNGTGRLKLGKWGMESAGRHIDNIKCPLCDGTGKHREDAEVIALMHSELSEALEELRNGKPNEYIANGKPEGYAVELADCIIRIFDFIGSKGINDFEQTIMNKIEYNKTRTYKHGGKKF